MENPALEQNVNDPKSVKVEASTQSSFCGEYSTADEIKPDHAPNGVIKVSPDEINSFFCHEVFGPLKEQLNHHQCTICGRVFPYRYQLIVHTRYHTLPEEKGNVGVVAGEAVPDMKEFGNNWAWKEEITKPQHPCSYCGRCFTRKEHLASHITKHTGESAHECQLCYKRFSRKDHLDNHMRAHDSDFKCHICLKIFTRKEHLVNHVQWHTGTSPHRCALCRKVFTRKEHLVNHVRQHTGESPHVCRFCGKAFTRKEHVVNHERGHTGETPFKCGECGRAFTRRDHLVTHERSHAGLSPFKCGCGKAFTKRDHLLNHQRHQHSGLTQPESVTSEPESEKRE